MDIQKLLPLNHVVCGISPDSSRQQVFEMLTGPLQEDGIVTDAAEFISALNMREEDLPTQADYGVALPHAASDCVERLGLVVGLVGEPGMVFDEERDERCRILFLMAVPSSVPSAHLPLLSHLAVFLHNEKYRAQLLDEGMSASKVQELLIGK